MKLIIQYKNDFFQIGRPILNAQDFKDTLKVTVDSVSLLLHGYVLEL